MNSPESDELNRIIGDAYQEMASRASHREIREAIADRIPRHLDGYVWSKGLGRQVTEYLKHHDVVTRLPFAPVANDEGQHIPLDEMTFAELEHVARTYLRKGVEQFAQSQAVVDFALAKYGRLIDLSDVGAAEAEGVAEERA